MINLSAFARPWLAAALLVLTAPLASSALAQASLEPPSSFQSVDRFGVNLVDGTLQVSSPTITVGDPSRGGLSFTATWDSRVRGWRYSNWGYVKKELAKPDPNCFAFYTVVYMGGSNIFQLENCGSNNFDRIDGYGSFVKTPTGYTYTARDGSVATYSGTNTANIVSISKPSGEVISYAYGAGGLVSVSNNLGYQLHFDYANDTLSKVTALNNAVDTCTPSAATCTYSINWPSLTFAHPGTEYHVTDALGRNTRVIYNSNDYVTGKITGIARPTTATGASISYTLQDIAPFGDGPNVMSVSDGAGTWTYAYESYCPPIGNQCPRPTDSYDLDTTVTDPLGGQTVYNFVYAGRSYWTGQLDQQILLIPALYSIKDALAQTTYVYQSGAGLDHVTYPEGNSIDYARNDHGNITSVTRTGKSGSGLTTTVTMTYPVCGANPILCHRPTSMTDARGSITDYTYDNAGNLLTETMPAPTTGAVRPQTRYTWEQRYAWYKRDGSSAITQALTPVWVQTGSSQCTTGATCQ